MEMFSIVSSIWEEKKGSTVLPGNWLKILVCENAINYLVITCVSEAETALLLFLVNMYNLQMLKQPRTGCYIREY